MTSTAIIAAALVGHLVVYVINTAMTWLVQHRDRRRMDAATLRFWGASLAKRGHGAVKPESSNEGMPKAILRDDWGSMSNKPKDGKTHVCCMCGVCCLCGNAKRKGSTVNSGD